MPQIKPYYQQDSASGVMPSRAVQPSQEGTAIMLAAKELGDLGNVIREQESRTDVSNVYTEFAKTRAQWTQYLREKADTAKPGDMTFAEGYAKDLTDYLTQARGIAKTAAGQQTFDRLAAEFSGEATGRAWEFQSKLAGQAAKDGYLTSLDRYENTLLKDPTQYDAIVKLATEQLNDPNGQFARLSAPERVALNTQTRERLSARMVQGLIFNGAAELALRNLKEGRYDDALDPKAKAALLVDAQQGIEAQAAEQRRKAMELRAEQKAEREAIAGGFLARIYQPSAENGGRLTIKEILGSKLEATGENSKEHFIKLIESRAKEAAEKPIKTIPSVMTGLFDDIRNGRMADTSRLDKAYVDKQISFEDLMRLRKEFADMRTPGGERLTQTKKAFFDGMKAQIDKSNPLMGKIDVSGTQKFYEFQQHVDDQIEAYRKAGKEPYDLFNPSKPDYLGKPESLRAWQTTLQESTQAIRQRTTTAPRPLPPEQQRRAGESIDDWKKRTGN